MNLKNTVNTWVLVTLDDVTKKITDGSHNPPKGIDYGSPMLSARNIQNNFISYENVRYLSNEDYHVENLRTDIQYNDILLTTVGTIGRSAIVPEKFVKFTLQRSVTVLKSLIEPKYLLYALQAPFFQKQLLENAQGTAQKGVYLNTLKKLIIPLAPPQEQIRIVERIEELISELEKSNKELDIAKQKTNLLLKSILNSAFTNKSIVYKSYTLKDITLKITDGSHFSPKSQAKGMPYITVKDIKNDLIDFVNCKKIDKESFDVLKKNGCSPLMNDILFSKDGTVGKVALNNNKEEFVVLSSLAIITPNLNLVSVKYLYYYLKSDIFLNQALSSKKGVAIKRIVLKDLRLLNLNLPDLEIQNNIVNHLEENITSISKTLQEIEQNILANNSLIKKIYDHAFQGKLTSKLKSDGNIKKYIQTLQTQKKVYNENQVEINKTRVRFKKENIDLKKIINKYFDNNFFTYAELFTVANLSKLNFSLEFEKLESKNIIIDHFDEKSGTIKYSIK
nr:restriction endonuclease subunit S [uncultured Flavobacterium sp.]